MIGRALALAALLAAAPVAAQTLRLASFHTELERDGPGLLLRDIRRGDAQIEAVVRVIAEARPDIVLLQGIDHDHGGEALSALAARLSEAGAPFPHHYAPPPNTGLRTGLDLDGDGRTGRWADAQGFGAFTGQGGMALLSRHPILTDQARNFSALHWADLPGARLPQRDGAPFPSAEAQAVQRLSTTAHWDVPVQVGDGVLHVLAFHATPPVFDGPEDRNGLRNADEIRFWQVYLDGALPGPPPPATRFAVMGVANLDPADGDGQRAAIAALLADPRLQDVAPASPGGAAAPAGRNPGHMGNPALDTAAWDDPGHMRVSYILPSSDLEPVGAGVLWPETGEMAQTAQAASRHRLVWVDIDWP